MLKVKEGGRRGKKSNFNQGISSELNAGAIFLETKGVLFHLHLIP